MWLKAMKTNNLPITRIPHEAAARLGLQEETARAYQVDSRRDPVRARDILWARGVEVLECLDPGASSGVERTSPA